MSSHYSEPSSDFPSYSVIAEVFPLTCQDLYDVELANFSDQFFFYCSVILLTPGS